MGGTPPLGYRPDGRSLAIVEEHAAIVRDIYRRYLEVGNVKLVADQLAKEGRLSPARETAGNRRPFGGCIFTRGQIYFILKNPIYVGDIAHREKLYAGQRQPIIDRDTWQLVQAKLADHIKGDRRASRSTNPSLLAGLIVDEDGEPLIAAHACKGRVRYRYYVSRRLQHGDGDPSTTGMRLPAKEIETCVTALIAEALDDPLALMAKSCLVPAPSQVPQIIALGAATAADMRSRDREVLRLIAQVRVLSGRIEVDLSTPVIADLLHLPLGDSSQANVTLTSAVRLTRTGRTVRLVQNNGSLGATQPDVTLVKLIAKARHWWKQLVESQISISELAAREGVSSSYATRIVRLAFLAPAVVDAILRGKHLASLDGGVLTDPASIPSDWRAQARRLLPT